MTKKHAQELPPESRTVEVDTGQLFSEEQYNLAEVDFSVIPQDDMNRLREDWIDARRLGNPLYIVDSQGRMFYVSVGGDGRAITIHSVVPRYEIQEAMMEYAGPDAWHTLYEHLGPRYDVVPLQNVEDSNVAAHAAATRNPAWFRVVRYLVNAHMNRKVYNPYKKDN